MWKCEGDKSNPISQVFTTMTQWEKNSVFKYFTDWEVEMWVTGFNKKSHKIWWLVKDKQLNWTSGKRFHVQLFEDRFILIICEFEVWLTSLLLVWSKTIYDWLEKYQSKIRLKRCLGSKQRPSVLEVNIWVKKSYER